MIAELVALAQTCRERADDYERASAHEYEEVVRELRWVADQLAAVIPEPPVRKNA